MTVKEAAEALEAALGAIEGARVYRELGATLDPPALVLGPPALSWEAVCREPTAATFIVHVVEAADERALERLWLLVPQVAEAIDSVLDASVRRADPGTYPTGGSELPSYSVQVDVAL